MNSILNPGDTFVTQTTKKSGIVQEFLGGGTQGEVYRVILDSNSLALKFYFPRWIIHDIRQEERLKKALDFGQPNNRFLWPIDLASVANVSSYGYIMPLRETRFRGIVDLMKRKIEPSFRTLATAGFELADSYFLLHSKGLCYRDISFGNVFIDPETGEVRICDNDNVDINGKAGSVDGTPRFMAPEIVRGEASPSTQTDLFSLAVLLFYMLHIHHPLEGAREQAIHSFDLPAMQQLYGKEPIFIFDPDNQSNRPVVGVQDNPIAFWQIYPQVIRKLFTKAFTRGITDPENGRVRETEWRNAMINLRDSIIYCSHCGAENFYDGEVLKQQGALNPCWHCHQEIFLPPRIKIGKKIIMLNYDTKLYPHHIDLQRQYDFSIPLAEITQNPQNPQIWGLKNLSNQDWTVTIEDNNIKTVASGKSVKITANTKINFSTAQGEIRT